MMISLLNNVQSDQEPKARVKDTTGGAIAQEPGCALVENDMAKLGLDADNARTDWRLFARSDKRCAVTECRFMGGWLNRSTQHEGPAGNT
jgi:hypothetical protein